MSNIESKGVIGTTDQCPHCKHIIPSPHCSQNIRTWAAKLSWGNENRHAIDSLFIIETQLAELAHLRTENARLRQIEADAKAANLIGPDGKFRELCVDARHPLPLLGDGSLYVNNGRVWHCVAGHPFRNVCVEGIRIVWTSQGWVFEFDDFDLPLNNCYSTALAAIEAARKDHT
ncbi:MAG: hypothetical protein ACK5XN_03600 [Bacteroidota bacterium]|jgi:hypothetical protein